MRVYTHKHTLNAANTTKVIQQQVMGVCKLKNSFFQISMDKKFLGLKHSQLAVSFLKSTHGSTKANHLYVALYARYNCERTALCELESYHAVFSAFKSSNQSKEASI